MNTIEIVEIIPAEIKLEEIEINQVEMKTIEEVAEYLDKCIDWYDYQNYSYNLINDDYDTFEACIDKFVDLVDTFEHYQKYNAIIQFCFNFFFEMENLSIEEYDKLIYSMTKYNYKPKYLNKIIKFRNYEIKYMEEY